MTLPYTVPQCFDNAASIVNDQRAVIPVRQPLLGANIAKSLTKRNELAHQIVIVREYEVTGPEVPRPFAGTESRDFCHSSHLQVTNASPGSIRLGERYAV